jgi:hypothetical protein
MLFEGSYTLTEYGDESLDFDGFIFIFSGVRGLGVVPDDLEKLCEHLFVQIETILRFTVRSPYHTRILQERQGKCVWRLSKSAEETEVGDFVKVMPLDGVAC